jgi:nucleotide-binding universal stress UspA family protein
MRDIHRILCPTDFSDASAHALRYAMALAAREGARLFGLYVHTPLFMAVPALEMAGYPTEYRTGDQLNLDEVREDMLKAFRSVSSEVPVEVLIRTGDPVREILDAARTLPADLIVIGTHGSSGFDRVVLGSVAEKVLRKAVCPVLTVSPQTGIPGTMPFKRILCATDFSEVSAAALELATSLAREAETGLTLLHVVEWPQGEEPLANRHFNVPEYRRYLEQDAAKKMRDLVDETIANRMPVNIRLAHGKPYREILALAEEEKSDLIVMGVQGRNALDLTFFGSTANHVVRRAPCPVLTLRQ